MYSQNNEEQAIIDYFGQDFKGVLIDIGAYDPFVFSNTRKLFEMGWECSFVEPSKSCFEKFQNEYKNCPNVKLFNFALGTHNGFVDFYDSSGDAISTTSLSHVEKWKSYNANFQKTTVEMKDINEFLSKYQKFDFLSIDVESTNFEIFNAIDTKYFENLRMLCIEHDGFDKQIENRMTKLGFRKILINAENIMLVR